MLRPAGRAERFCFQGAAAVFPLGCWLLTLLYPESDEQLKLKSEGTIKASRKRLSKAEKRLNELDHLFIRIYEDNVSGRISDERFALMSKTYEDEQAELKRSRFNLCGMRLTGRASKWIIWIASSKRLANMQTCKV